MRNWDGLADEIKALTVLLLPADLAQTQGIQEELRQFDCLVLLKLEMLLRLSLPENDRQNRIRRFLAMRWSAIANTSLDYTFNPNSPANQACLLVAKKIRNEDEAICQILMPSVEKILGAALPDDLKLSSEDLDDQFVMHDFVTDVSGHALIAIQELLQRACINPDILFSTHTVGAGSVYSFTTDLTADDFKRVRAVCGETGAAYFDALKIKHCILHKRKPSVGHALQDLITALLKSSIVNTGSDWNANLAECYQPTLAFYQIWTALSSQSPNDVKNQIKLLRAAHNHNPKDCLESQLLCLFDHTCMPLTQAERDRVKAEEHIECAHQIALALDSIFKTHAKILCGIPIPGKEAEFEHEIMPDDVELTSDLMRCQNALKNRAVLPGVNNEQILMRALFFDTLTESCFDPQSLEKEIQELCNQIGSIEDFINALLISSPEHWRKIIQKLGASMDGIIACDNKSWDALTFILKQLPAKHRKTFCDALCVLPYIQNTITPRDLCYLTQEFPEKEEDSLSAVLHELSAHVLLQPQDIAMLFSICFPEIWERQYFIFQDAIESIIDTPEALHKIFSCITRENWLYLAIILKKIITKKLSQKDFIKNILYLFNDFNGLKFIEAILPVWDEVKMTSPQLMEIMKIVSMENWDHLFTIVRSDRLSRLINSECHLAAFLSKLDKPEHRIAFIRACSEASLTFKINPHHFYELIQRFKECTEELLKLFLLQLPKVLTEFSVSLTFMQTYQQKIPEDFYIHFDFFLRSALPLLFLQDQFEIIVPMGLYNADPSGRINNLQVELSKIEDKIKKGELEPLAACFQKIALLDDFIKYKASPQRFFHIEWHADRLATFIARRFGDGFFEEMLKHKNWDMRELLKQSHAPKEAGTQTQSSPLRPQFFSANRRQGETGSPSSASALPIRIPPPPSLRDLQQNLQQHLRQ